MNFRPQLQFYKSIFPFVVTASFVGVIAFGVFYGFLFFLSFGFGFGLLGFQQFKKKEWYTYFNLGITKWQLIKSSFVIHLVIGIPFFTGLYLIISFLLGDFSIR